MFKWKRRIEGKISEKITGITRKGMLLILFLMSVITTADFYFNGFSLIKLILLELIIITILVNIALLKI